MAKPTGDKPTGDLKTALQWCCIGLRQVERVRESIPILRADLWFGDAGWESLRLGFLFWGDVQFLITSVFHMTEALDGLSPQLPKRLSEQTELLRHTMEHWDDAPERKGRWKTLFEKHNEYASPWTAVVDDTDIWIGPDKLSVHELEQALTRLLDEPRQMDTEEDAI